MPGPLELRFLTSAPSVDKLPPSEAEVAIVGRSNVGKSSLVNSLANRKQLANTSKTPGRTQLLNCFAVGAGERVSRTLVDCPGYGYASAPQRVRNQWQQMMDGYLLGREPLTMVAVLVDGEIGPTKLDVQMLDFVRAHGIPHSVVATKHDKVKAAQREKRKRDLAAGCQLEPGDIIWTSADKGVGIDRLRSAIHSWLG